MITIAGGTGLVGKHLTHALLREGAQVRVLTRDPQKAKAAFGEGKVEIAGVDFDDPKTLRDGFKGSDRAFLSMGASDRQVRDEIALIDAATDSGVPFLVNLSIGGAGRGIPANVLEWHSEIDAHVATKAVISTLVRPATYTDTVVGVAANFVPSGQWGGVAGTGRVSLTDTRDIAAVSAVILLEGAELHGGKVYDLSGPAAVTMQDVARFISAGLGKPVAYHSRTVAEQRAVLQSVGMPTLMIDILLAIGDATRLGLYAQPTTAVFDLTGKTPRTVDAWVANTSRSSWPPPQHKARFGRRDRVDAQHASFQILSQNTNKPAPPSMVGPAPGEP